MGIWPAHKRAVDGYERQEGLSVLTITAQPSIPRLCGAMQITANSLMPS